MSLIEGLMTASVRIEVGKTGLATNRKNYKRRNATARHHLRKAGPAGRPPKQEPDG